MRVAIPQESVVMGGKKRCKTIVKKVRQRPVHKDDESAPIASIMIGVMESLLYAKKAGLGMDAVIDVIGKGAASSWSINNLGRQIAADDFNTGFFIKHFVKDMAIAPREAHRGFSRCLRG